MYDLKKKGGTLNGPKSLGQQSGNRNTLQDEDRERAVATASEAPMTMALVPFNLASPFCNQKALLSRSFSFTGIPDEIVLKQQWSADGRGGTELGFGAAQYEAGIVLAQYVALHFAGFPGKSVLEIGCGIGLVSVVVGKGKALLDLAADCGCLSAGVVVATDGDHTSVALARANAASNNCGFITVQQIRWGDEDDLAALKPSTFDVVLAADVVCLPYSEHFPALIATLQRVSVLGTDVWLAYKRRDECEDAFFQQMDTAFELIDMVGPDRLDPDFALEQLYILHYRRR